MSKRLQLPRPSALRPSSLPFLFALFFSSASAFAQSAPTLSPSAPDLSSPKAALTSLYQALKAGDLPAAKSCLSFSDAAQAESFDVTYTQLYAPLQLMHAVQARFGDSARKVFALDPVEKSVDALLEKIKTADIQITDDAAVIEDKKADINPSAESELTGISFKKEANRWKVVAGSFMAAAGDIPPNQMRFMRALRDATAAACQATAARLAKGDFKSADEAYADYQTRIQEGTRTAASASATPKSP